MDYSFSIIYYCIHDQYPRINTTIKIGYQLEKEKADLIGSALLCPLDAKSELLITLILFLILTL